MPTCLQPWWPEGTLARVLSWGLEAKTGFQGPHYALGPLWLFKALNYYLMLSSINPHQITWWLLWLQKWKWRCRIRELWLLELGQQRSSGAQHTWSGSLPSRSRTTEDLWAKEHRKIAELPLAQGSLQQGHTGTTPFCPSLSFLHKYERNRRKIDDGKKQERRQDFEDEYGWGREERSGRAENLTGTEIWADI